MKRVLLLFMCLSLVAGFCFAQQQGGNIYGTVTDEGKTALPGITVTLLGEFVGQMTTITDNNGNFRFISITPGTYDVKAELQNYATLIRKGITVALGANVTLIMVLEPKKLEEEIVVTAEPVAIDAKKTTYATNLTKEELQTLPSARDPFVILELTPGLVLDRQDVGGSESGQQSNYVSRGTASTSANWNTDGVNTTDQIAVGGAPQYYDFDAFEEIQIQTAANDITALTAGTQINMITRRGGNNFRAGGRFYFTDDSFQGENAPDDFPEEYTPAQIHQIIDTGANIGGPVLKDKLWFWLGVSMQDIQKLALTGDMQKQKLKNFEFKVNTNFGNHRLEGFFNWSDKTVAGRISNSHLDAWEAHYNQSSPHPFMKIQDEFTVSDNMFLSAKASYFEGGFLLSPIGPVGGIAIYDAALGRYLGTFYESDYIRHQYFYQLMGIAFVENLFGASHEMKIGTEYKFFPGKRVRTYYSQRLYYRNYEAGIPYRAYIYRNSDYDYNLDRFSVFFQDSITTKNLTILLGLRYDRQGGKVNSLDVPGSSVDWAGEYNLPAVHVDERKLNFTWNTFAPRIGIIYDFSKGQGKTLGKINFGIYGDHIDPNFPYYLASTYGYVYWNWNDANGDGSVQTNEISNPRTYDYFQLLDPSEMYDSNLQSPLTMEITAGVEHELVKDIAVGANFIYRRMYNNYEDYYYVEDENGNLRLPTPDDWQLGGNIPAQYGGTAWWEYKPGLEETTAVWYTQRPDFYERYLGFELTFKKRMSANSRWMLNGSFTYQRWTRHYDSAWGYDDNYDPTDHLPVEMLDGQPSGYVGSGSGGSTGASLNPRWIAKLGWVIQMPLKLNFGGTVVARDGYILPEYYTDFDAERNGLGDNPDPYTAPYGTYRLPTYFMVNLRLERAFKISVANVIFSIDVFNLFNSNTTLDQEFDASRTNYGEKIMIISPRVIRLGLRLDI